MSNRDDLFQKFGPLLIEAIARATLDQINILRSKAGLSTITYNQAIDEIQNHISHLDEYSWMIEPFSIDEHFLPQKIPDTQVLSKPRSFINAILSKLKPLTKLFRR